MAHRLTKYLRSCLRTAYPLSPFDMMLFLQDGNVKAHKVVFAANFEFFKAVLHYERRGLINLKESGILKNTIMELKNITYALDIDQSSSSAMDFTIGSLLDVLRLADFFCAKQKVISIIGQKIRLHQYKSQHEIAQFFTQFSHLINWPFLAAQRK